jgi:hypothetical protein
MQAKIFSFVQKVNMHKIERLSRMAWHVGLSAYTFAQLKKAFISLFIFSAISALSPLQK